MPVKRPYLLTIGGLDPSAGAGILADIKTFEQHRVYGMAVNTANTVQDENEFRTVNWLDEVLVLEQLNFLLQKYQFSYVKIGILPSFRFFNTLYSQFTQNKPDFIFDPVLAASSGFDFLHDVSLFRGMMEKISLLTPNWKEAKLLSGNENPIEGMQEFAKFCNVYLKGGHHPKERGTDYLFVDGAQYEYKSKLSNLEDKHGSGCVFSSSLAANLALGYPLQEACLQAKQYVSTFLASQTGLLGNHH